MIMTLIVIMDKDKCYWDLEHSGHHHLKILEKIIPRFRYSMFGPATKKAGEKITAKQLMKEIESVSNEECCNFEELKDLRVLKGSCYNGYILISLGESGFGDAYNELYVNVINEELDTDEMADAMKYDFMLKYKYLKKKQKDNLPSKKKKSKVEGKKK